MNIYSGCIQIGQWMRDIVYIVKKGDHNEELRYSLRSLKNLKHNNVFIAGFMPNWVTGAYEIPVKQTHDPMKNTYRNLLTACKDDDLTDEIIVMHDDIFIMKPTEIKTYIRGYYKDILENYQKRSRYTVHVTRMQKTMEFLQSQGIENPKCFELHVPFIIDRKKFVELDKIGDAHRYNKYSLYANLNKIKDNGVLQDVKVHERDFIPEGAFISTHERSFHHKPIGKYIRKRFERACEYEK